MTDVADEQAQAVEPTAAEPDAEQVEGFPCDICGSVESSPMRLGLHKRRKHGVVGKSDRSRREREERARSADDEGTAEKRRRGRPPSRAPRRPPSEGSQAKRKRMVKETIVEFLDFTDEVRGRSELPDERLAEVIRRDAEKIASSLAWAAERFTPLGLAIDRLAGHGSIITFVRGFLGVGRHAIRKWRQSVAEREQLIAEEEWIPGHPIPSGRYGAWSDQPAPLDVDHGSEG